MLYKNIVDSIGNTPLVEISRLSPNPRVQIYAKLEGSNPTGSVKDRIAKYMIERAERSGELTRDRILLEPTSGNTGIALAMIGRYKGYKVEVVMPESVSIERRQLLELFGAKVHLSDGVRGTNGSIEVATQIAQTDPRYLMLYQYGNSANPQAHYETTGPEIIRDLPDVDVFIAGDDAWLDGKMVVASRGAFIATRELTRVEGIFAGISAGSAIHCAKRTAARMDGGKIVVLLADGGWKYLSTDLWNSPAEEAEGLDDKIWW
ncbi:MAG: cysteine synthase family protein [Chloroflexi bacterium]|nr:cysteine synthase family protein [Chloroflexota bacterium]